MIVILMGVSGSGKTTIGKRLAESLGWVFFEGDEFHPQANITKMGKGIPLSDKDRQPWLNALKKLIRQLIHKEESAVIACSALKTAYRQFLEHENEEVYFVYLKGDYELIRKRLEERSNHYMKPGLLSSQFADLQEPEGVITVDIRRDPEEIVRSIQEERLRPKEAARLEPLGCEPFGSELKAERLAGKSRPKSK
jgi:gluconokinase